MTDRVCPPVRQRLPDEIAADRERRTQMIEIIHRHTRAVLYHAEDLSNVRAALVRAVAEHADLRGAFLRSADLRDADLRDADLGDADLRSADLGGADLCDADLCDAGERPHISWTSHDTIAEILRRAAADDLARLQLAGLVLLLGVLAEYVREGETPPWAAAGCGVAREEPSP